MSRLDALNRFATPAQRRLIFEEAFLFQMGVLARRRSAAAERKPRPIQVDDRIRESARQVLPFKLTSGQKQALKEIVDDLQRPHPMNRLLQGDVGAGKTIVALLAALVAMENGLQVAFMAPTEILAEQHFAQHLAAAAGFPLPRRAADRVGAGGRAPRATRPNRGRDDPPGRRHARARPGRRAFHELGLVVIDEQHRFGVLQRATLRTKGYRPDVLVMTATPIPRTLALTVYGDLDVSVIRDLPPGRLPIKTTAKPESRRDEVYAFVRGQLDAGRQAYVIYPLVEESGKIDVKAATEMADHLAQEVFPQYRIGLLHGRMKADGEGSCDAARSQAANCRFWSRRRSSRSAWMCANATVMIVEHAERFGLSQLHQLRGRVGRGAHQSYCFLLYQSPLSDEARERLKAMAETTDGFEIAERDLRLRGPGDFFGTRQAGVPTFRMIDLVRDRDLLDVAQREAARWFERQRQPPTDARWTAIVIETGRSATRSN